MFYVLLLVISVPIHSNDDFDWCPIVKPNGIYNGLRVWRQYTSSKGDSQLYMSNRANSVWHFNVFHNGSDRYHIELSSKTVAPIEEKGVLYRFAMRRKVGSLYYNCRVESRVKNVSIFE